MRIDKFFSELKIFSRKETAIAVKQKRISVNGEIIKCVDFKVDEKNDLVLLDNNPISYNKYTYVMLNKPQGVVSATEDGRDRTVIDLLPPNIQKLQLFPCGRLDKDTLGLIILTNDGISAHKRLAPKSHVEKMYKYECAEPLLDDDKNDIERGVTLKDGTVTKPCKIIKKTDTCGEITLIEGKYHEIKRLFGYLGNKITYLERISFGQIQLDENLSRGEWRYLTEKEIEYFIN